MMMSVKEARAIIAANDVMLFHAPPGRPGGLRGADVTAWDDLYRRACERIHQHNVAVQKLEHRKY